MPNLHPPSPNSYTGPWPRKKHSHLCLRCQTRGQGRVACYKTKCSRPAVTTDCAYCRRPT